MAKTNDILRGLLADLVAAGADVLERAAERGAESVLEDVQKFGQTIDRKARGVQDRLHGARRRRAPRKDRDEE